MGNKPSRNLCRLSRECKGRDDVVKDVRALVHDDDVDVIVICGAPMIGKSMVLIKAFLEEQEHLDSDNVFLYHNFDDCKEDDVHRAEESWSLKINRFAKGEASDNKVKYKILLDRLISSYENQVYLYLDNVDMLKKWDKLAELLELVKDSVATHDNLKVIFSTSTQVPEITNGLVVVKVPVLPIEHISSLITNVCVSKQVNVDESQKLYIPLIGTLCDGIPYIATTAGSILSENQGLILPSELLELMIAQRLEVLSPTNYPTSNRFVALTGPISESSLNIEVRDFLSNLAQKLRSTFTEDEAVQCNDDTRDTAAMVKNSKLRPLLICCILAKDKKLCLPTVFKECKLVVDKNLAQENHGENAEEVKRLEDCRLNLTRENLTRLNLTITDRQLENPKEVEKIIKSLMDTAKREPEENFDSFGSKILEELGLDCNFFGIPDVQTPDGKPEPTVAYGGSGSGLEFVQLRKDAFRKEFFGNDTSSLGSLNYDQFSYAYKDLSENHINMKSDDIVSQKDLLSNGPHALDVDPDYKGNETLESIHSESYTCKKETVALYDHDINKILLLNDNKNTPKVRGEQMPLQSSGPNGIMYVNNAAEEIKLHPQISEEDSGIEHGSDVHMRRTTD